jgi:ribosomal protein L11 methyltransferase
MSFYEIEFPLASLNLSEVEAALLEIGARSITFVDRGDEPVLEPKPGEFKLWSDTLVRALFEESGSAASDALISLDRLSTSLGSQVTEAARVRAVAPQVWERAWLKDWKPMRFGRRLWCGSTRGLRSAPARIPPLRCACKYWIPCRCPAAR